MPATRSARLPRRPTAALSPAGLEAAAHRPLSEDLRLDLSGVARLSAEDLARLVYLHNRARDEGGSLALVNVEPGLRLLLALDGFDDLLPPAARAA